MNAPKNAIRSIRLPQELLDRLTVAAGEEMRSVNNLIVATLTAAMDARDVAHGTADQPLLPVDERVAS